MDTFYFDYYRSLSNGDDIPMSSFFVTEIQTNDLTTWNNCDYEDYWDRFVPVATNESKFHAWETLFRIYTREYPHKTMIGWHMAHSETHRITTI